MKPKFHLTAFCLCICQTLIFHKFVSIENPVESKDVETEVASSSLITNRTNVTETTRSKNSMTTVFYSEASFDGPGGAMQDMLYAHAYGFANNRTYGGVCVRQGSHYPRLEEHKRVIKFLGLQYILRLHVCKTGGIKDKNILHKSVYYEKDTAIWTKDWVSYIQSKVKYSDMLKEVSKNATNDDDNNNHTIEVAVHIQRGDVTACTPRNGERYLPNSHYVAVINHFVPKNKPVHITIYSESRSDEPLDLLRQQLLNRSYYSNTTMKLDGDSLDLWRGVITSDIAILSKSSLSLVLGMLNPRGEIIATPFWHQPLPTWKIVPDHIMSKTAIEQRRVQMEGCQASTSFLEPNAKNGDTKPVFYSKARDDRTGAALQDMLLAHAYAFERNMSYGGACINPRANYPYMDDQKRAIQYLGLQNLLSHHICEDGSERQKQILNTAVYYEKDTSIWTEKWISHIQSMIPYPDSTKDQHVDDDAIEVAVHIRRGDVTACYPENGVRYLPNSHYLAVIDHFVPKDKPVHITIFSESTSYEPLQLLEQSLLNSSYYYNTTLRLDGDILDVWRGLMMSDIVILSKSSFSLVLAMLNRHGEIIATPFWHRTLPHWKVVPDSIMLATKREHEKLRNECKAQAFYSKARFDEPGGAMQDMLYAHAYGFANNMTYGGACVQPGKHYPYMEEHKRLIKFLGLQHILQFHICEAGGIKEQSILDFTVYYAKDTAIWTKDWISYIKSKVKYGDMLKEVSQNVTNDYGTNSHTIEIAVHIQRGDVKACTPGNGERYLPNSHYLAVINHFVPKVKNLHITIYSQSKSDEPLDLLRQQLSNSSYYKNTTMRIDGDSLDVWRGVITSDIAILSKSSLSLVLGMLNPRGEIIATPFWHKALPKWRIVPDSIMSTTNIEHERLKNQVCNT